MFRIVWDKPEIGLPAGRQGVGEGVHNLLKKPTKKEREQRMVWSHKERVLVGIILAVTILASIYFWYKGQGHNDASSLWQEEVPGGTSFKLPSIDLGGFGINQTIILEK